MKERNNEAYENARSNAQSALAVNSAEVKAANLAAVEKADHNFAAAKDVPPKPLKDLTPTQQYQKVFATKNAAYDSPSKSHHLANTDRARATDAAIGQKMISNGKCNKQQVEQQFLAHSPHAAKIEKLLGTEARDRYCKEQAEHCDRKVNVPKEENQRTKTQSHESHPSMANYHEQQMAAYQIQQAKHSR